MSSPCMLCPRKCGVDREKKAGFCRAPLLPRVAAVLFHIWEEPCLIRGAGAGAVFFSGCPLRCVYCQNHEISQSIHGEKMTSDQLERVFFRLEEKGASCLDLISPTPYLETLLPALKSARHYGLKLPVVYNTSGYETVESLQKLEGLIDVYLPDLKYCQSDLSKKYSGVLDYFPAALKALKEMRRQTGKPHWESDFLKKGVIVRHLVLPGWWRDSLLILQALRETFEPDDYVLSLMRQYIPVYRAAAFPELNRKLTTLEYNKVVKAAEEMDLSFLYTQKKESASASYVPDFFVKEQVI